MFWKFEFVYWKHTFAGIFKIQFKEPGGEPTKIVANVITFEM